MAARKAGKPLDLDQVNQVFLELSKYAPYVPVYQAPEPAPAPPLRDPRTGALMSRARYTDTSVSVFEDRLR